MEKPIDTFNPELVIRPRIDGFDYVSTRDFDKLLNLYKIATAKLEEAARKEQP